MAKIIIEKWKCDRCGVVHDKKPIKTYPRVSATFRIEQEWSGESVEWGDICQKCSDEIKEAFDKLVVRTRAAEVEVGV